MTEAQARQKIVSIMQGWIGRKEADGSHRAIVDIYNAHKPLARGYKVTYTDAWCATAVSAAFIAAGMTDIGPTECSCIKMIERHNALGQWMEADNYVPKPGDIIMYDWQDTGKGDNAGTPDHVGIVERVDGEAIIVIEGNINDSVGRRAMPVNGRNIRGYCLPNYAAKVTTEPPLLSQEDFDAMMDNYLSRLAEKEPSAWSKEARAWAEKHGIVKGDESGKKKYKAFCTREELVQMLFNREG